MEDVAIDLINNSGRVMMLRGPASAINALEKWKIEEKENRRAR